MKETWGFVEKGGRAERLARKDVVRRNALYYYYLSDIGLIRRMTFLGVATIISFTVLGSLFLLIGLIVCLADRRSDTFIDFVGLKLTTTSVGMGVAFLG